MKRNAKDQALEAEIQNLKDNFDEVYAEQAAERQAYFDDPANAERIAEVQLGLRLSVALYKARKASDLTQEQLAERLHTRQSYVADVEAGRRNITIATLGRIASACGKRVEIRLV